MICRKKTILFIATLIILGTTTSCQPQKEVLVLMDSVFQIELEASENIIHDIANTVNTVTYKTSAYTAISLDDAVRLYQAWLDEAINPYAIVTTPFLYPYLTPPSSVDVFVLGANSQTAYAEGVIPVALDRTEAFYKGGEWLASKNRDQDGTVIAIFYTGSETRSREMLSFLAGYKDAGGNENQLEQFTIERLQNAGSISSIEERLIFVSEDNTAGIFLAGGYANSSLITLINGSVPLAGEYLHIMKGNYSSIEGTITDDIPKLLQNGLQLIDRKEDFLDFVVEAKWKNVLE